MKKLLLVCLMNLPFIAVAKPYTETYKGGTMHIFKSDNGQVMLTNRITEDKKPDWNTSEAEKFKYVKTEIIPDRTETMPEYGKKCTANKLAPVCRGSTCSYEYVRRKNGECD